MLDRRVDPCEDRDETGQDGEHPTNENHDDDALNGHPRVVQQGLVHDGEVAVQAHAGQVEDRGSA